MFPRDQVPRLRRGLRPQPRAPGADLKIVDEILPGTLTLEHLAAGIVDRIDGARSFAAIADGLRAWRPRPSDEAIAEAFRSLLLLNVLEGSGERILEAAERHASASSPVIRTPPGARARCQGSGNCCRVYHLGPLTERDLERIRAIDVAEHFPDLAGIDPVTSEPDVGPTLTKRNGTCLFQDGAGACRIHSRLGSAAKPDLCRLYPLSYHAMFDGVELYDDGECARFGDSSRTGTPLEAQVARARELLPDRPRVDHPTIRFDGRTPCDFGHYKRLLDAQRAASADERSRPSELLARVTGSVAELASRFAALPIEVGQPDRVLDEALVAGPQRCADPDPADWVVLADVCGELTVELLPLVATTRPTGPILSGAQHHGFVRSMQFLGAVADERADPDGAALPTPYAAAWAVPMGDGEREYLHAAVRQFLHSTRPFRYGGPRAGVLQLALLVGLTALGARLLATIEGRGQVDVRHLDDAHTVAIRTLRTQWERLRRFAAHATSVGSAVVAVLHDLESTIEETRPKRPRHLPILDQPQP